MCARALVHAHVVCDCERGTNPTGHRGAKIHALEIKATKLEVHKQHRSNINKHDYMVGSEHEHSYMVSKIKAHRMVSTKATRMAQRLKGISIQFSNLTWRNRNLTRKMRSLQSKSLLLLPRSCTSGASHMHLIFSHSPSLLKGQKWLDVVNSL